MRLSWIVACAAGEAAGISIVATIYAAIDRGLLGAGPLWILCGGAWEGVCLGTAQAVLLRNAGVRARTWIAMTAAGAVLGYGLSLLGGAGSQGASGAAEPPLLLLLAAGAALGAVMGILMGAVQWLAAREVLRPTPWIVANAIGWSPGMAAIMLAATSAGSDWPLVAVAGLGAGAGAVAGIFVGAATSLVAPVAKPEA